MRSIGLSIDKRESGCTYWASLLVVIPSLCDSGSSRRDSKGEMAAAVLGFSLEQVEPFAYFVTPKVFVSRFGNYIY